MDNDKKLCSLWRASVRISDHNNNGNCPCLECKGDDCTDCEVALIKAMSGRGNSKCFVCQKYIGHVR